MKIRSLQICSMMSMLMLCCFLGILDTSSIINAKVDFWMIPLLGMIIGLPILFLFLYIFKAKEKFNINDLNNYLFGKTIGKIINIIFLIFVLNFSVITLWNLTNFVSLQYLYNTPMGFINLLFIIPIFYFFSRKESTIFRASLILFFIILIFNSISFFGLLEKININNFKPILENGFIPVLKGVYNYLFYAILPIFIILIIPKDKIENKNIERYLIITYIITNILIFLFFFEVVGVFGIELTSLYEYPTYHVLKRVFIGGFIERLENILSIQSIILYFVPCAFSYYYSFKTLQQLFNVKKHYIYIFLFIIMYLSQFIFQNNILSETILIDLYPLVIGILFFIILCIISFKIYRKKKIHNVSFD